MYPTVTVANKFAQAATFLKHSSTKITKLKITNFPNLRGLRALRGEKLCGRSV